MATKAGTDKPNKVFDVAKPGKTAASSSSRPIIISHQSSVEDPMVAKAVAGAVKTIKVSGAVRTDESQKTPEAPAATTATLSSKDRITIKPLASVEPSPSAGPSQVQAEAPPEAAKEEPTEQAIETSETAAVNAVAEQAGSTKGRKAKDDEQEAARLAALEKIIESKKYAVPISETRQTRALERLLIGILLVMLLAVIGFNLAIDAGLIQTDIQPFTDLIKN